jgi:hypothetical protein
MLGKTTFLISARYLQSAGIFLVTALLLLPPAPYQNITSGLDNSWVTIMNHAVQQHWVFGRDIIFTFGPLAFLSTRFSHGIPAALFWHGDILLITSLAFGALQLFRRQGWKTLTGWMLALYILRSSVYQFETAMFLSFLLLIVLGIKSPSVLHSILIILTGTTLLFIKVNYGLIAFMLLFGYLIFQPKPSGAWSRQNIFVYIFALVCPVLAARLLHTDLLAYLRNSIDIVSGFNEAMNKFQPEAIVLLTFAYAIILMTAVTILTILNLRLLTNSLRKTYLLLLIALSLFILFKQSFTRADLHVLAFPASATALLFMLYLIAEDSMRRRTRILTILSGIAAMTLLWPYADPLAPIHSLSARMNQPTISQTAGTLPKKMREQIGQDTVDILTWESSHVYFEKLNYFPRPVFQSYSAYTETLGAINLNRYKEGKHPKFIILKLDTIDTRFPMGDEPQLYRFLLSHYELADSDQEYILLKRRPVALRESLQEIASGDLILGQEIPLPADDNMYLLSVEMKLSIIGKIMKTLFQAPMLFLTTDDAKSEKKTFRIIRDLWRKPVIVSPLITSATDFAVLLRQRRATDRPIRSLNIHHNVSKSEKGHKLKSAAHLIDKINGMGFSSGATYRLYRLRMD